MRRVLLDQGLAPATAAILRYRGWDALHVSEINMHTVDDLEILEFARNDNRVCVTLDHDFHTHLAVASAGRPSVVMLRVQGLDSVAQATLITAVWQCCETSINAGAAVSADMRTVRVRRLPLK
jgi:predicted nuclease of predicted toxin-antitoxin system